MAAQLQNNTEDEMISAETCNHHEQFYTIFFCYDCKERVCANCVSESHQDHRYTDIKEHQELRERKKHIENLNEELQLRLEQIEKMKRGCREMTEKVEESSEERLLALQHQTDRIEIDKRDKMRRIDSVRKNLDDEEDRIYALQRSSEAFNYNDSQYFRTLKTQIESCISSVIPRADTYIRLNSQVELHSRSRGFTSRVVEQQTEEVFLSAASSQSFSVHEGFEGSSMSSVTSIMRSTGRSRRENRYPAVPVNQSAGRRERSGSRDTVRRDRRTEYSSPRGREDSACSFPGTNANPCQEPATLQSGTSQACKEGGESRQTIAGTGLPGPGLGRGLGLGLGLGPDSNTGARPVFLLGDEEEENAQSLDGDDELQNENEGQEEMEERQGVEGDESEKGETQTSKGGACALVSSHLSAEVSSLLLHQLAEQLPPRKLTPLGLRLGLNYSAIEIIEHDNPKNIVQALYKILQSWKKGLSADQPVQVHYDSLACVLDDTELFTAAEWLRKKSKHL